MHKRELRWICPCFTKSRTCGGFKKRPLLPRIRYAGAAALCTLVPQKMPPGAMGTSFCETNCIAIDGYTYSLQFENVFALPHWKLKHLQFLQSSTQKQGKLKIAYHQNLETGDLRNEFQIQHKILSKNKSFNLNLLATLGWVKDARTSFIFVLRIF